MVCGCIKCPDTNQDRNINFSCSCVKQDKNFPTEFSLEIAAAQIRDKVYDSQVNTASCNSCYSKYAFISDTISSNTFDFLNGTFIIEQITDLPTERTNVRNYFNTCIATQVFPSFDTYTQDGYQYTITMWQYLSDYGSTTYSMPLSKSLKPTMYVYLARRNNLPVCVDTAGQLRTKTAALYHATVSGSSTIYRMRDSELTLGIIYTFPVTYTATLNDNIGFGDYTVTGSTLLYRSIYYYSDRYNKVDWTSPILLKARQHINDIHRFPSTITLNPL